MEGPLILDVLEALAPGEAGPPRLVLDLQTETQFSCFNYRLVTRISRTRSVIAIDVLGINKPEICLTAPPDGVAPRSPSLGGFWQEMPAAFFRYASEEDYAFVGSSLQALVSRPVGTAPGPLFELRGGPKVEVASHLPSLPLRARSPRPRPGRR